MAPSCTLENGIKLEHLNPPSALCWWFQQMIPALCHECRRVIRAEHFDDPAAPFLCNICLEKLPWFEPQGRCPYCGLEIEPGSKTPCSHGVSRTWHLDRLLLSIHKRGSLRIFCRIRAGLFRKNQTNRGFPGFATRSVLLRLKYMLQNARGFSGTGCSDSKSLDAVLL